MKKTFFVIVGLVAAVAATWLIASQRHADELALERAQWSAEKAALEQAVAEAGKLEPVPATTIVKEKIVHTTDTPDARKIIERLLELKVAPGPTQSRHTRMVVQQFENLIAIGSPALPIIGEFLARNVDLDYDSGMTIRGSRDGKIPTEFMMPPSLRFGLLEATRRIGGPGAEKLLAESLTATGRGAEVAFLAYTLNEIAPGKYRDLSVNSARELLSRPIPPGGAGLDKYDREYLYGVLAFYGDQSVAGDAQSQLVAADGSIDRASLRYLQQTLGAKALPSVVQAYENSTVAADKKEPLVRYALTYAGVDPQATEFWHKAVNDPAFPMNDRREMIEDLNQDGIQSESKPTLQDAPVIAARLELIERFFNETEDPQIRDAWREAGKDLKHMAQRFLSQPTTGYVIGEDTKALRDALQASIKGNR